MTDPRVFVSSQTVRFGDVDQARILYFPKFFHYYHVAFEDYFNIHLGLPYHLALHRDQVGFPTVHIDADFKRPFQYGDTMLVHVHIGRVGTKSADFHYRAFAANEPAPRAHAKLVIATFDMRTLRAIPIPEPYRAAFTANAVEIKTS